MTTVYLLVFVCSEQFRVALISSIYTDSFTTDQKQQQ